MVKMVCNICNWVYDPATGYPASNIKPGTAWEDVSTDFVCPDCGAAKDAFLPETVA